MKVFSNKVGIKRDFPEKKFCIFSLPKFFVMLIFLPFSNASPAGLVPFLLVGMAYYHSDHLSGLTWYHLDHLSSLAWYHYDLLLPTVMVPFLYVATGCYGTFLSLLPAAMDYSCHFCLLVWYHSF